MIKLNIKIFYIANPWEILSCWLNKGVNVFAKILSKSLSTSELFLTWLGLSPTFYSFTTKG